MRYQALFPTLVLVTGLASATVFADSADSPGAVETVVDAPELERVDRLTLKSSRHLVTSIDPAPAGEMVNAVIEIPTGTTAKWEVAKESGNLVWELRKGKPRQVKYLGYPGNYGMIPQTLLPEADGGDGDPLDILVLGPAVPRGSVQRVQVIGLLRMLDKGEQDDKLIAVPTQGVFRKIDSIEELDEKFPGVSDIVNTWFANYKGQDKIQIQGYAGPAKALEVLERALAGYREQ